MPMPLNQLLPEAGSSILIRELTLDSRKVRPGDLFLAVPGTARNRSPGRTLRLSRVNSRISTELAASGNN
jgi:UDP-N-acetylmuramyl tripeptide synthase